MKKQNTCADKGYMDAEMWRNRMRIDNTKKINDSLALSDKEDRNIYKEFAEELFRVRQFVSAFIYESLQKTSLTGKQIKQQLDLSAERYTRMKEPSSGEETIVGNYTFNTSLTETDNSSRKRPEAFFINLKQLYRLGYYILNRSCQSILLGTEDVVRLPNIYNCLFSQYAATPRKMASRIGKTILTECKRNVAYFGTATMNGNSDSDHCITTYKDGSPVDFQEIFTQRLRETIEDKCCYYENIFGSDANNILRKQAKRCLRVDTERNREVFESFLPTKNGEAIEDERLVIEPLDVCTISNLMILSMFISTAVDYYVAPDYTRYAPLLIRTNEAQEGSKKPKEVKIGKEETKLLSALLLCDPEVKSDILSSTLSDLWLAQYISLPEAQGVE